MPLESMKLRLCDLIDRCLDILAEQQKYIFHLDAQTVVLEDYLNIRPSRREELKKYISESRLMVGPWYLQSDFYLTSGEATIRNLLEGRRIANEFGKCDRVGYAPDQFGNISQLPQILNEFDIDNFVFGRGLEPLAADGTIIPSEFLWEGADGSRVLAVHMRYWYNNAQHFSPDPEKAKILVETNDQLFEGVAVTPYILMMNGVDHLEAQDDLLPILERLNSQLDGKTVRQERMSAYVDAVRQYINENQIDLHVHHGELKYSWNVYVLTGTLSSRFYLKAANVKAQVMLENKLEPLYTMLELAGAKGVYSVDHFRYMWKNLMLNHPHDSICGCSRDEVHSHMEDNYARLETTTWDMLNRGMLCVAEHLDLPGRNPDNYIIAVANTTQEAFDGVVELNVDIPKADGAKGFVVTDGSGNPADFVVLSSVDTVRDGFSPLNLPGNFPVTRYRVALQVDNIQPFAVKGYLVRGTDMENKYTHDVSTVLSAGNIVMENNAYRLTIFSDGRVDIQDKASNRTFADVFEIEDTYDAGDSYFYNNFGGEEPIYGSAFPALVEILRNNHLVQEILITRDLVLPAYFDFMQKRRSKETAVNRVSLRLILTAGNQPPEIIFSADNRSRDHRLRLLVNTGLQSEYSIADIPFDIIRHNRADSLNNPYTRVQANTSFAAVEQDGFGLAVLTEGAHEYEHLAEHGSTLAFTLIRATGVICRDASSLQQIGGDQWTVPENQCLRTISARFSLLPFNGDVESAGVPIKSVQFRTGLNVVYTSSDITRFMKGRAAVQDSRLEEYYFYPDPYKGVKIPDNKSLLTTVGDGLLVTALKKAENGDSLILRVVNLKNQDSTLSVQAPGELVLSNMSEKTLTTLGGNSAEIPVAGKKIVTVKIDRFV